MPLPKLLTQFFIFLTFLYCNPLQAQLFEKWKAKRQAENYYLEDEILLDTLDTFPVNKALNYKGAYPKHFDLLHTKLVITPSFSDRTIDGTAFIKIHGHFNPQSEIILDAKGMTFDSITYSLDQFKHPLTYEYDGLKLKINLPKTAYRKDTFELKILYTAHPYLLDDVQGKLGQGAYFINSQQTNPYRSTIFWTQGETEASSCWFPTFDAVNQKTSQEIFVTVPDSMVSISNGVLIKSKSNKDGTRTDYWKQDKKHSPYLMALVIGPFQRVTDHWRDLPLSYYALAPYVEDVQAVFGRTPKMLEFFSNILNYDFPWDNYKQVAVYDFVAGAMENTSLSIFHELLMSSKKDLYDKSWGHDLIIAHELMHHWFGNLVTPESWSQLTLSESFANYGENLWLENWKGKEDAQVLWYKKFKKYMYEYTYKHAEPIVQNYYNYPNEVFNRHRYEKGAAVLHLLRTYIGDEAFFEALSIYLKKYAYQTAEVHQLRMAFEKVVGEDLNWFFDQWFYHPGHPIVDIKYSYDASEQAIYIEVEQKQMNHSTTDVPLHKIIVDVDFIYQDSTISHKLNILNRIEAFTFKGDNPPLAINFDPGKNQLWEATYNYTNEELAVIYNQTKEVLDQIFVIDQFKSRLEHKAAAEILLSDLKQQHWFIRESIIDFMPKFEHTHREEVINKLEDFLLSELPTERNKALLTLHQLGHPQLINTAKSMLQKDSSYLVMSTCLRIISETNITEAYELAKNYTHINNSDIEIALISIFAAHPKSEDLRYFERIVFSTIHYHSREVFTNFEKYLLALNDEDFIKGLGIIPNIIEYEYPNQRVDYSKRLLKNLNSITVGNKGMTEMKKMKVIELNKTVFN